MLMALGQFVFEISNLAYHELQRSTAWRHPSNSRVGEREASQFIGQGEDTFTLSGTLVPEVAGRADSLQTLRGMGDAGRAYAMVSGAGRVMGAWVILSLQENSSAFTQDGLARRTDFTLQLKRVDDEQVEAANDPSGERMATIDNGSRMGSVA
jgi:phage protein U